jgi:hypothetical protein
MRAYFISWIQFDFSVKAHNKYRHQLAPDIDSEGENDDQVYSNTSDNGCLQGRRKV